METNLIVQVLKVSLLSGLLVFAIMFSATLLSVRKSPDLRYSESQRKARIGAFEQKIWLGLMPILGLSGALLGRLMDSSDFIPIFALFASSLLSMNVVLNGHKRLLSLLGIVLFLVSGFTFLLVLGISL